MWEVEVQTTVGYIRVWKLVVERTQNCLNEGGQSRECVNWGDNPTVMPHSAISRIHI